MELVKQRIAELEPEIAAAVKAGLSTLHHTGILKGIIDESIEGFWKGDPSETTERLAERILEKRRTFLPILELAELCETYAKELANENYRG